MKSLSFVLLMIVFCSSVWGESTLKHERFTITHKSQDYQQVLRFKGSLITSSGENSQDLLNFLKRKIIAGQDMHIYLYLFGGELALVNKVYDLIKGKCDGKLASSCKITTEVEMFTHCSSACVPLFMVGDERIAAERSNWGFHQTAVLGGYVMVPFVADYVLLDKGVNREWLRKHWKMFWSLKMTYFQPNELGGSGIITQIIPHPT